MVRLALLLLVLMCWAQGARATSLTPFTGLAEAQLYFETTGNNDTIPDGIVTTIIQDQLGMLWIGTQNGLLRYDGYRFRHFLSDPQDPSSLVDNHVSRLWVAPDGRLWVGSPTGGLSVFDPNRERFTNYHANPAQTQSLSSAEITALTGDATGGVWVGTREAGLNYLPASGKGFFHYRHQADQANSLHDDRVRSLLLDKDGQLWIGTNSGLQRFNQSKQQFDMIASSHGDPLSLDGQTIRTLFQAKDGKIWLSTQTRGVAYIEPSTLTLHWLPNSVNMINNLGAILVSSIIQPQPDQIWLGQRNHGIIVLDAQDGHFLQRITHDGAVPGSLALDNVNAMYQDRAGLLWVGMLGGGLQRSNLRHGAFAHLRFSPGNPHSLSHANILSILELANGQILVGTDGNGIDLLDRQHGFIKGYRAKAGQAGALQDSIIFSLAQTPDGTIWAGSQRSGLHRLVPGSNTWQNYTLSQGLPDNRVGSLLVSHTGQLWAGTDRGLARWQSSTQRFEVFPDTRGNPMHASIHNLMEDREGRIWCATTEGLWLWDPHTQRLQNLVHDPARADSLAANSISGLLQDRRGNIWIDTGQGLDRLISLESPARFEHVSAQLGAHGLLFDGNMLEDQQGRIWSHRVVFDPQQRQLHPVGKPDGFFIGTSWTGSYARTRDGLFLFGGTMGLGIVNPERFAPWTYPPDVVVSELDIDGIRQAAGASSPELRIQPGQRSFGIEFSALDFSAPQKNQYRFRLQGYQDEWTLADADHRYASYGNLSPGSYVFQVRATNRNGQASPHSLAIPVRVLPNIWQTHWFLTLVILLLCSILYLAYRWRLSRIRFRARATQHNLRLQAQALQEQVQARTADILKLGSIGQELTATLDTEQAFERVYRQISARLDAHVFSIGIHDAAEEMVRIEYLVEDGKRLPPLQYGMDEHDRPAVWCVRERRELIAGTPIELLRYVSSILPAKSGRLMESIVYLPLIAEQRVIGCLSVQSPNSHAYNEGQIKFLHVLASYTAIAVANSQAHSELAHAHQRLQQTQQQLIFQEKMAGLGTLTAGVAHEINNPTNFAHVAAQNLQVDLHEFQQFTTELINAEEAPEVLQAFAERFSKLADHVSTMLQGTERIKGIVRDLRAFTRLEQAEKKTLRLSECLLSTLNLVRTSWQDRIEFHTDFIDDPAIECWPALLNQVFMNLLINACQAIAGKHPPPNPGQVTIRMQQENDFLAIAFSDNGTGIKAEHTARILEPFFTTKAVGEGTGLGLSIAYGIIVQHGGHLDITSTEGEGSCFTLYLPLMAPRMQQESADGILCAE